MSIPWGVGTIIYKRALNTPNKTALIFDDKAVTYKELNLGVNRCAYMLQKKGLKKGDRICVVLLNCVEFLEMYFAAAKLGLIFVPLNWRLVGPELQYQLNDCEARLVLFHNSFLGAIDLIRNHIKVEEDKFIFLKSDSSDTSVCPSWADDYTMVTEKMSSDEPELVNPVVMDDPLAIVYTSGVTGDPKGAVLSHEQTFFKNFQVGFYTGAVEGDVLIAQMPLFHSGGLFIIATPSIMGGIVMIMRSWFDPDQFAEDIERYKGTVVFALTTMWKMILDSGKLDKVDISSVKTVVGGGERTPPSLFDELAKRGLYMQQGFGQTENSAMMVLPKEDIHRKMGSIGKPGFFTDIWIQDTSGKRLPPGEVGEIVAQGPTVMSKYWNLPEQTKETLVDGVLFTGDLGYIDEEGYFYIVDRAKDMYRSGGENVYPAEIEKILLGHKKISMVSIIGVVDDKWGETGMAFIVPFKGQEITLKEIKEFLSNKVAKYKHPAHVKIMTELPLTATMKVKKAELKEKYGRVFEFDEKDKKK